MAVDVRASFYQGNNMPVIKVCVTRTWIERYEVAVNSDDTEAEAEVLRRVESRDMHRPFNVDNCEAVTREYTAIEIEPSTLAPIDKQLLVRP